MGKNIFEPLESCSSFNERNAPGFWGMCQIAWILDPNQKAVGQIGFIKPGTNAHRKLANEAYNLEE